ncbi:MAG TPA: carboxypeptidase regulatory-like domain-containing protein [Candidatus Acidoferrales bacterium]|nr:carboxypeptidase regulatory-like domain-containing protein [Candidatus Acidoferrales bacterium]
MRKLTSILATFMIVAFAVGPVSAATVPNPPVTVAQNATATVQGIVKDDSGAPIAGAHVELRGPQTYATDSDSTGAYSIGDVAPGVYVLAVSKPGYQSATESDFTTLAGQTQSVQITMHAQTFTSLRTIATVRAFGQSTFNTSTAAVNVVNAQTFVNQAQPQVGFVLNQIPGVQNTLPTSSANGAVPGAITVPNIRGALSNETASLIDGHPLAVGDYGDFVTTFLSSYLFDTIEVIKGPGAMSPETNYAIGGTVNFHTKDPTATFTPDYTFGVDNFGGTYFNFGVSDTIGRLGFVVDVAGLNEPSALSGKSTYFQVYGNNGVANWNGTSGTNVSYSSTYASQYVPGSNSKVNSLYGLLACCYTYGPNYNGLDELFKLRYKFSSATTATVSYLGGQTYADQNENTGSEVIPSVFNPAGLNTTNAIYQAAAATYSSTTLPAKTALTIPNGVYPQTAQEIDNEPIFQAEVRTLVGQDTLLARYYHASIDRLIYEGNPNPATPVLGVYQLYGVSPASSSACAATTCPPVVYTGQSVPMAFFDWYNQWEEDRLNGMSAEYDHSYGDGNDLTLSIDQTNASSTAGSQEFNYDSNVVAGTTTWAPPTTNSACLPSGVSSIVCEPSVSNPQGTSQVFTTIMARNIWNVSPKINFIATLYDNLYQNTFPYECLSSSGALTSFCATNGSNAEFTTNHTSHFDERFALEFRPENNLAIRLSAGSAISPPYLSLLSKVNSALSCSNTSLTCTYSSNNPNLLPETAWGYDVGADYSLKGTATVISVDGYLTNLYNHFLTEEAGVGTCGVTAGYTCTTAANTGAYPIYESLNTNLNNARFEGLEFSVKRTVPVGLGFSLSGAVQHAYAYNLPVNFYCQNLAAGVPCTPANYNVNLPIIAGENFTGNTFGTLENLAGTASIGGSGFSNTAIPYFQGDFEANYTTPGGIYALIGETVYGKNNGYNLPPFGIGYASIRVPLNKTVSFQVSGWNIFNAWTGDVPVIGGGLAYPLANGGLGATIANTVGPATYRFQLTKTLP